jgi:hypothetical protein
LLLHLLQSFKEHFFISPSGYFVLNRTAKLQLFFILPNFFQKKYQKVFPTANFISNHSPLLVFCNHSFKEHRNGSAKVQIKFKLTRDIFIISNIS